MYFGILHKMESLMVQQKELSLRTNYIDALLFHQTKRRRKGLVLKCPEYLSDALNAHV